MKHPYETLDPRYFWSSAVARRNMFDIEGLWDPKFRIGPRMKVSTFGSCFAQHIGKALKARGFNWFIAEPAPAGLSPEGAKTFNYGVFSARTGNIYTVSLLKQWVEWATGDATAPAETWETNGRFYDPFRPNIEPEGFASVDEMLQSRDAAIEAFRTCITESDVFVFTLGLTESWINTQHQYEYPMCPGTVAGDFDESRHAFVNQDFPIIRKTLVDTIHRIRKMNPKIRFLLTVSPVPLTATMSGNHVLVATMESKSILRAIAGTISRQFAFVDYFPSYEIINATPFRGTFFEQNQRSVNHAGVDHVMNSFFSCLSNKYPATISPDQDATKASQANSQDKSSTPQPSAATKAADDVVCEEELLAAFGEKKTL